jgi:hypothetical protein
LRDVQVAAGGGEGAVVGNGDEVTEVAEFHIGLGGGWMTDFGVEEGGRLRRCPCLRRETWVKRTRQLQSIKSQALGMTGSTARTRVECIA